MIEGIMFAFGEFEFAKDHLDYFIPKAIKDRPNSDWPPKTAVCLLDLPPYVLDWILGVLNYVDLTGDKQELEHRIPLIIKTLEQWGTSHVPFGFYFFDWDPRIMHNRSPLVTEPIMTEAYPAFIHKYIEVAHEAMRLCELFGLKTKPANAEIFVKNEKIHGLIYIQTGPAASIYMPSQMQYLAVLEQPKTLKPHSNEYMQIKIIDVQVRLTSDTMFFVHLLAWASILKPWK